MINHPNDLHWIEGDLPDVHMVPKNCSILVWFVNDFPDGPESQEWKDFLRYCVIEQNISWEDIHGKLRRISVIHPWSDQLNPLRWCDSSGHPIGYQEKAKYWAWVVHPLLIGKMLNGISPEA